jgi:hypothetical protein
MKTVLLNKSLVAVMATVGMASVMVLMLMVLLASQAPAATVLADGGPDECNTNVEGAFNVDPGDVGQSGDQIIATAPDGSVITGICIKSGEGSFGPGTQDQHSDLITVDGDYGENDCFNVSGIGTDTVTVTREDNPDCHEISHVDVFTEEAPEPPQAVLR